MLAVKVKVQQTQVLGSKLQDDFGQEVKAALELKVLQVVLNHHIRRLLLLGVARCMQQGITNLLGWIVLFFLLGKSLVLVSSSLILRLLVLLSLLSELLHPLDNWLDGALDVHHFKLFSERQFEHQDLIHEELKQ